MSVASPRERSLGRETARAFGPRAAALLLAAVAALAPAPAASQNPQRGPRIGYVYPAGGRRGTTFEVAVGGQFLDGVRAALFSGRGVEASVREHTKPPSPKEVAAWRERLKALAEKRAAAMRAPATPGAPRWSGEEEKELSELRARVQSFQGRPPNPAISETARLEVRIAADADLGGRELRLLAAGGLTNPVEFRVGALPELREEAPAARESATRIALPAVANGQILPGDADRFRFAARKGERLVFAVEARRLVPYLADAVPGWFQAVLSLYDGEGREVAYADDYRFDPDPVLFFEVPSDGEYELEIRDALYRGREDFAYRIAAGAIPFIEGIFPLGARTGAPAEVEVRGWNLPCDRLGLSPPAGEPAVAFVSAGAGDAVSNRVPFEWGDLPEIREEEPTGDGSGSLALELPAVVNGRIERPGDRDEFRFEGRAGSEIVAEIRARRLGSPLDSALRLLDPEGREIAANDDAEDRGAGLVTHHADSYLALKLPSDGRYRVLVADAQGKGGPDFAYRLRLGPPRPEYELRIAPSSVSVRPGRRAALRAVAIRRDGFSGEIRLELEGAPPGFALAGARIPAGEVEARVELAAPPRAAGRVVSVGIIGRAEIGGREIARRAVPADAKTQAFAYEHLVPARELLVAVLGAPAGGRDRPRGRGR